MPVSKKRQKKQRSSKPSSTSAALPAKTGELSKKKKYTTQQILIMVFSAIVVITMSISLIITGLTSRAGRSVPIATTGPAAPTSAATAEPKAKSTTETTK
jgi:hypothetical protein